MKSDQRTFDIIQERNFGSAKKKSVECVLSKNNYEEQ
jgi:hypothetical protein